MRFVNQAGERALLPKMTDKLVFAIEALGMRSVQPMKDTTDRIQSIRYRHEMNVVGHEAVSQEAHAAVPTASSQQLQVIDAIGFISKYIKTPGTPLGDMHRHSRHDKTCSSRHCVN
jgi:hypothetical protein